MLNILPRTLLLTLLFSLLLGSSLPALAWGPYGHRLIGIIAEANLSDGARAAVRELLDGGTLAEAGTWADEMRGSADNPVFWSSEYTGSWHYINIGPGANYAGAAKNPRGDAYLAITTFMAILEGREAPDSVVTEGLKLYLGDDLHSPAARTFALRFYVHLIEDLHQPIHVGYPADRGGNAIAIEWKNENTNLHALWDTQLIVHDAPGMYEHAAALALLPVPGGAAEQTDPMIWIDENLALRDEIYAASRSGVRDAGAYHERFYPVAARRLQLAGLRLASYLNTIFER